MILTRTYNIPIIRCVIKIVIFDRSHEFTKKFDNNRFLNDIRDCHGYTFELDDVIYIALRNDEKITHGIVAHECKHAVNIAMIQIGQKLDVDNDEFECYLLSYIVDKVYKHLIIK